MADKRHNRTGRSKEPADKFVALRQGLRESAAWRSLSFAARAVYIEMAAGVHQANNGQVPRSVRFLADAVVAAGSTVERALTDLIDRGFIVRVEGGHLGPDGKGKPSLWRLTEIGTAADPMPTKDYVKWQPPKFKTPSAERGHPVSGARTVGGGSVSGARTLWALLGRVSVSGARTNLHSTHVGTAQRTRPTLQPPPLTAPIPIHPTR